MRKPIMLSAVFMCTVLIIISFGNAHAEKVLVNIWDGTEWTKISRLFDEGKLPNAKRVGDPFQLTCNKDRFPGCDCTKCRMKTETKPQHATMLTGVLADEHGVFSNSCYQLIPDGLTVYERIESRDDSIKTAHISSKPSNFGEPTFGNIIDDVDFFLAEDKPAPRAAAGHARRLILEWHEQDFFIVVHFNQPDTKGHLHGVDSNKYEKAILNCDSELGGILDQLDSYGILEEAKIYILSDHGFGTPRPRRHGNAPNTFIISNDETMTKDMYMMNEVAGFLLANFGLEPPAD